MKRMIAGLAIGLILGTAWANRSAAVAQNRGAAPQAGRSTGADDEVPIFEFDPTWPKMPFPNEWVLGTVVGVRADASDNIWIVHRPHTILPRFEDGAISKPVAADCCTPAPPVMEFDQKGNLLQSWGGPGVGYTWPEHPEPYAGIPGSYNIATDSRGNIYVADTAEGKRVQRFLFKGVRRAGA
jgi:hypothetical protein